MQIISSLISLQSRLLHDERDKILLDNTRDRVRTMGIVHELLYKSVDISSVNFTEYVDTLISEILSHQNYPHVKNETKMDDVKLNIETALTCELIINEIITNSLHAFPPDEKGRVNLTFKNNRDYLTLNLSDNGVGMKDADMENARTLGLRLVKMLIKQLKAELTLNHNNGTRFIIKFKELDYN
ncbi:MAG: sensor histidine kinase [Methanobacteriaceae archaeon]|nr:sensor histidine kinase [Methanobacteriaceae archaeon]